MELLSQHFRCTALRIIVSRPKLSFVYCTEKASGWFFRHEMSDLFQQPWKSAWSFTEDNFYIFIERMVYRCYTCIQACSTYTHAVINVTATVHVKAILEDD